jgi:hypothetical protein
MWNGARLYKDWINDSSSLPAALDRCFVVMDRSGHGCRALLGPRATRTYPAATALALLNERYLIGTTEDEVAIGGSSEGTVGPYAISATAEARGGSRQI